MMWSRNRPGRPSEADPSHRILGAMMGLLSAGVAIGVAQLVAGFVSREASPVVAVGSAAIDLTPEWLKAFAIRTFGEQDKTVLLAGIGAVLAIARHRARHRVGSPAERRAGGPRDVRRRGRDRRSLTRPTASSWTPCPRSSAREPGLSP